MREYHPERLIEIHKQLRFFFWFEVIPLLFDSITFIFEIIYVYVLGDEAYKMKGFMLVWNTYIYN